MAPKPLRLIFMGTPQFAVPSLQALLAHGEKVVAVVTQPDRPSGRGKKLTPPPVKEIALAAGIPVFQPTKIRTDEFREQIRALQPDCLIVAAYGRILPGPLLNLPPLGTINVHGSLLPKYRGAAPIQWAILNGEPETGITIMQMDEGMDTGDILLQRRLAIAPDDTGGSLALKMADLGGAALLEALELLKADKLPRQPQDNGAATLAPPLDKNLSPIDWKQPAARISCQIRGLDPWPLAHTFLNGKQLRLFAPSLNEQKWGQTPFFPLKEKMVSDPIFAPGTIIRADRQGLLVATGDGLLLIKEIQREGGKRMAVGDFSQGHPLPVGAIFTSNPA